MSTTVIKNPFNILRTRDFDPEKLTVTQATATKYKSLQAFINYPNSSSEQGKVYYQTPIMHCPFGLTESKMNEEDEPKYYIEMSFNATTDKLEGFHKKSRDVFVGIDKRMIDVAVERSAKWFKRKKNRQAIIDDKYKSALKCNKDEEGNYKNDYADRLCFKILLSDKGKPNIEIFNHLKEPIKINTVQELENLIHSGTRLKAIVQASSVWIGSTGCGISWKVIALKIYPSGDDQIDDYAFEDDSDVEELN